MNDDTAQRFKKLLDEIGVGTSPLTNQDVTDAMKAGLFPLDAPSVEPDPFIQLRNDQVQQDGRQVAAFSLEMVLTTLEERLKRTQEGRP